MQDWTCGSTIDSLSNEGQIWERILHLQNRLNHLQEINNNINIENIHLQSKCNELQHQNTQILGKFSNSKDQGSEWLRNQQRNNRLEEIIVQNNKEIYLLKQSTSEYNQSQDKIEKLQMEKQSLKNLLKAKKQQVRKIQADNVKQENQIQKLKRRQIYYQNQIESEKKQKEGYMSQLEKMQAEVLNLIQSKDSLNKKIDEFQLANDSLLKENLDYQIRTEEMKAQVDKMQSRMEGYDKIVESQQLLFLQNEQSLNKRVKDLENLNKQQREEIDYLNSAIDNSNKQLSQIQEQYEQEIQMNKKENKKEIFKQKDLEIQINKKKAKKEIFKQEDLEIKICKKETKKEIFKQEDLEIAPIYYLKQLFLQQLESINISEINDQQQNILELNKHYAQQIDYLQNQIKAQRENDRKYLNYIEKHQQLESDKVDLTNLIHDMQSQIDEIKNLNSIYNKALQGNSGSVQFEIYNQEENTLDNSMQYSPSSVSPNPEIENVKIAKLKNDKKLLKQQLQELQASYDKLKQKDDIGNVLSTQKSTGIILSNLIQSTIKQRESTPEPIIDDESDSIDSPSIGSDSPSDYSDF